MSPVIGIPDYWCEDILVARVARSDDDAGSDNYFEDPFAEGNEDPYSGSSPGYAFKVAEGKAFPQEERVRARLRNADVDHDGIAFFDMYFIVQSIDNLLPEEYYGSVSDLDKLYLYRLKEGDPREEGQSSFTRYTVVLARTYPNGVLHIYVVDGQSGGSTTITTG